MWLSRAGVIEQADSAASPPTITSATISSIGGATNAINFVTSENCTYTSTTGITVTSDAPTAVTVTAVSGTDTAGTVTLSRNIVGGEVIKLIFAATNGVTSQASGLPIQAVTFPVTNNAPSPLLLNSKVSLGLPLPQELRLSRMEMVMVLYSLSKTRA